MNTKAFSKVIFRRSTGWLQVLLLSGLLFLNACASGYRIVRSGRAEYPVNGTAPADSGIIRAYMPYKVKMDAEMNRVIGHSAVLMSKKQSDTLPESLLSNFFADAVAHQALKADTGVDFAMPSTKGGLRVDLPQGPLTVSHIFELMPFENELILFTLKGQDVQRLLDFIAAAHGEPVWGLKMKISGGKAADVRIGGKPFDPSRTYRVLTTDYISGGGDNAKGFENPVDKKILGLKVRDALMAEVKEKEAAGESVSAGFDGRITIDKKENY